MLHLPNGCRCSNPAVLPKDWKTGNASLLKIDWRIQYYFRDPSDPFMDKHPNGKFVIVKGMNFFKTLPERREATKRLLENELRLLQIEGYNPIKKTTTPQIEIVGSISPDLPFLTAMEMARKSLSIMERTKVEIKSVIKAFTTAAGQLGLQRQRIDQITRRHIKLLLEKCGQNNAKWSNNRYNKFRAYLMMLFKELVELEAVPFNPIHDISKKPVIHKIKNVLTMDQREKIDEHLEKAFPRFRQFVHLFFHSGGRKTELLQLKPPMVDLAAQKYRCIVKKGKQYREVERTIKSVAVPFWQYFLDGCPDDHFIFGLDFKPALKPMGDDLPTRYWKKFVKEDLGIERDLYSLKHLHSTEIVTLLDESAAAAINAHTSTAMVVNIYDVKQRQRQHERLKDANNSFV